MTLNLGRGVTMKLVRIPAGTFRMGSALSAEQVARKYGGKASYFTNEHPQHRVTITRPFHMGVHEVTRGQFSAFAAAAGYKTTAEKEGWSYAWKGTSWGKVTGASWRKPGFPQTDRHPVVCVSWSDATAFCKWLSARSGRTVALPTEAQWEYACRAGTTSVYQWGNEPDAGKGWCNAADQTAKKKFPKWTVFSWSDGYVFTAPVGSFRPNAWGLHDMHGNVWEWCGVWYAKSYANAGARDPKGPTSGTARVLRGGSWRDGPRGCRAAYRLRFTPVVRFIVIGFRVMLLPGRVD